MLLQLLRASSQAGGMGLKVFVLLALSHQNVPCLWQFFGPQWGGQGEMKGSAYLPLSVGPQSLLSVELSLSEVQHSLQPLGTERFWPPFLWPY